ncbi:MAG TPA: iron uptake transporter deferrochelatase/peroxidase subunit [Acidimicrobiales bacterium]|nr:iron uptake transporter deferrochelatase/peroxidase subunit [Acidimicrobiales bacterium]
MTGEGGCPFPGHISRRRLLGGLGLAGAGVALGAGGVALGAGGMAGSMALAGAAGAATAADGGVTGSGGAGANRMYPFYDDHQAGIVTPAQDRLAFAAMNVLPGTTRSDVRTLLRDWTVAAERMTRGKLVGEDTDLNDPPLDTGEAIGSPVGGLTVTIGYGPSLFDDRFGLAKKKPSLLVDLPPLPNENLNPTYTGGDLCIQACSDDPLVAFHAVRNLARLGLGVVDYNWMELGFGRTSTTSTTEATPRNLLGFKDGTRNIKAQQTDLLDKYVWVGDETDQDWLKGGSYLVARRIQIFIENWDRDYLGDQQNVIGRAKVTGAPLTGGGEFTTPKFKEKNDQGELVIPANAHIRLASHEENDGIRILRRGYSFTDGIDPVRGTLMGGLFFIAFAKRPQQFIALQQKLGTGDALNEYIQHIGSGLFAVQGGLRRGQHWGDGLFA